MKHGFLHYFGESSHCVAAVVVVANVAGDGGALHPRAVGPIWDPL